MKVDLKLVDAEKLAARLVESLRPHCRSIHIAGSIRRKRPIVGDIEIVAVPKMVEQQMDLIHMQKVNGCIARIDEMIRAEQMERMQGGEKWQRLVLTRPVRVGVDLFFATDESLPILLAIRTGPRRFSQRLVTPIDDSGFGLLPRGWKIKDGWRVYNEHGERVRFSSEYEFLTACACAWLEPEERN